MESRYPEWNEYTNRLISHVKFKFDHPEICREYLEHMEDMYEFYVGRGMDPDLAKSAVLEDMGDPDELGRVLNQIHNPVLGWIWRLSRWLVVLLAVVLIYVHGWNTYDGLHLNKTWSRQTAGLAYTVDVDEKRVLDYRTVYFDRLEVYEDGTALLHYTEWIRLVNPMEAGHLHWYEAAFTGETGIDYNDVQFSTGRRGWIRRHVLEFKVTGDIGTVLKIDYDWNQCQFILEIPLPAET